MNWELALLTCFVGMIVIPIIAFAAWVSTLIWKDDEDRGDGL